MMSMIRMAHHKMCAGRCVDMLRHIPMNGQNACYTHMAIGYQGLCLDISLFIDHTSVKLASQGHKIFAPSLASVSCWWRWSILVHSTLLES